MIKKIITRTTLTKDFYKDDDDKKDKFDKKDDYGYPDKY